MGSSSAQGKLWGQRPKDWADIQEETGKTGYDFVLKTLAFNANTSLLDVGCGTGFFCKSAADSGVKITGLDATPEFIEEAKKRLPSGNFMVGEMEELPFSDKSFDIVCGFNSFQYAANTKLALAEAKRVLTDEGKLAVMIWGNKADCETASFLKTVASMLPPPPPGAPGPFALSENELLENILKEIGFDKINITDVSSVWDYPNKNTAMKGLMSVGPVSKAIEHNGFEKVYETLADAVQPYEQANGHVVYHNKFRIAIASR